MPLSPTASAGGRTAQGLLTAPAACRRHLDLRLIRAPPPAVGRLHQCSPPAGMPHRMHGRPHACQPAQPPRQQQPRRAQVSRRGPRRGPRPMDAPART
jgi:hypothetical protein